MTQSHWRVRLGAEAESDFIDIMQYTLEAFGRRQAEIYKAAILETLAELNDGPDIMGSKAREEILPGLMSVHVARKGRRGRHFVMYRVAPGQIIEVLRILHDAMDLARHVPRT